MKLKIPKLPKVSLQEVPTMRERVFFILAIVAFLYLFIDYIVTPQADKVKILKNEFKSAEMQKEALSKLVEATRSQLAVASNAPKKEETKEGRVDRILKRRVIDPEGEINSIVSKISGRKFAKQVKIESVKLGERIEKGAFLIANVEVMLEGRYTSVVNYMELLEKAEMPIVVESFELRDKEGGSGLLEAKLRLQLLIIKA